MYTEEYEMDKACLLILQTLSSLSLFSPTKSLCCCNSWKKWCAELWSDHIRLRGWISMHRAATVQLLEFKQILWSCEVLLISEGIWLCMPMLKYGVMVALFLARTAEFSLQGSFIALAFGFHWCKWDLPSKTSVWINLPSCIFFFKEGISGEKEVCWFIAANGLYVLSLRNKWSYFSTNIWLVIKSPTSVLLPVLTHMLNTCQSLEGIWRINWEALHPWRKMCSIFIRLL